MSEGSWPELGGNLPIRKSSEFMEALRSSVRAELAVPGLAQRAARWHHAKAAVIAVWFLASYAMMAAVDSLVGVIGAGCSAGIALAGLAFNVQHDGGHGAFSESRWLNRAAASVLDLLGASSYLWRWKHNLLHHGNPNVDGLDDDVDGMPFLRLHPGQPWREWHRLQHFYCWILYPFVMVRWVLVSDLIEMWSGRIGSFRYPRPSRGSRVGFWIGKTQFVAWAIVGPCLIHGWSGLAFVLSFQVVGGFISAVAFQLAHAVEEAEHLLPSAAEGAAWEDLQLSSTVDFRTHAILDWYLGGLNYQAVHHLFPGVRHTLYPRIAPLLESQAERFELPYRRLPSLRHQIRSHFRFMRALATPGLAKTN